MHEGPITASSWAPDADEPSELPAEPLELSDEVYRAPYEPITSVPSAAPDYAEMRHTDRAAGDPIALDQIPEASTGYEPAPRYAGVTVVDAPEPDAEPPAVPIADVPLDRPAVEVAAGELIADVPFDVDASPATAAEPSGALIEGVPDEMPPAPPPPAPAEPASPPPSSWWRRLIRG